MSFIIIALLVSAICLLVATISAIKIIQDRKLEKETIEAHQQLQRNLGITTRINASEIIKSVGNRVPTTGIQNIFYRSKNPWNLTIQSFQFLRYFGALGFFILSLAGYFYSPYITIFLLLIGVLCFWYPVYYYKAIGSEREMEWNKLYEFIWVIKHNAAMYGPKRTFLEMQLYLQAHAPQDKEMIQAFTDFYNMWDENEIPEYIANYYPFSIPRELYQIMFNSNKTGSPGNESLDALRKFIINAQDLQVGKTLSSVSGKATIFSLPFLMFSVILGLMVPLIMQMVSLM